MTKDELITALNESETDRVIWKTAAMSASNEIAELKAQVNCLRDVIKNALYATNEQCLAEVKAKAIEDAIDVVRSSFATLTALRVYANQIREKIKLLQLPNSSDFKKLAMVDKKISIE
jgi:CO dehydrogenase/acetyl-CoA synthase gamma subunit (corrinoid Fe-S protein)